MPRPRDHGLVADDAQAALVEARPARRPPGCTAGSRAPGTAAARARGPPRAPRRRVPGSSSTASATGSPSCGAASPTPGAARIVRCMTSSSAASSSSESWPSYGVATARSAGCPACTMGATPSAERVPDSMIQSATSRSAWSHCGPDGTTAPAGAGRRRPARAATRSASACVPASTMTRTRSSVPDERSSTRPGAAQAGLGGPHGVEQRLVRRRAALVDARHVDEGLRQPPDDAGEVGDRRPGRRDACGELQRRQHAVAGGRVRRHDDVPGLLAAERVPAGAHRLEHVPVADRGVDRRDPGLASSRSSGRGCSSPW